MGEEVNKEDVIKGLRCCSDLISEEKCAKECPYYISDLNPENYSNCQKGLMRDALYLIEQG